jgi:hypothetical protein
MAYRMRSCVSSGSGGLLLGTGVLVGSTLGALGEGVEGRMTMSPSSRGACLQGDEPTAVSWEAFMRDAGSSIGQEDERRAVHEEVELLRLAWRQQRRRVPVCLASYQSRLLVKPGCPGLEVVTRNIPADDGPAVKNPALAAASLERATLLDVAGRLAGAERDRANAGRQYETCGGKRDRGRKGDERPEC